jgi:S-adenosylmethionine hydrolase
MARSQNSFIKKQLEQKKLKKRKEKEERKQERQENSSGGSLDAMMAYVDEFGNISSTPPVPKKPTPDSKSKD